MRGLLIPLLFFVILILAVVYGAPSSSDQDPVSENAPLPLTTKHETAILAAPDGTVYLVEIGSGKILWSFSSGPSIYSSYQQIPNHDGEKLNASSDGDNFYIDCGEDWELYLHGTGVKKVKLPLSAEEFVKRTPFVSAGGGVMLGSKKTSVFVVDAKTGKIVRTFRSDNLSSFGKPGTDETSIITRSDIENWLPASSADTDSIEKPLYITRTDYAIKYTSVKTGEVLWYLMFADIEASFQCEGIENFLGGFSQFGSGDMKLPCQTRPVVYRIRDRNSLEPLFLANRVGDVALPGGGALSLPDSDHSRPMDSFLAPYNSNGKDLMLPLPIHDHEEFVIRGLPGSGNPQISGNVESYNVAPPHFWSSMVYSFLVPIAMALFFFIRGAVAKRKGGKGKSHHEPEDSKLQSATPKKRKGRKTVSNKHSIEKDKQNSQSGGVEGSDDMGPTNRFLQLNPSGNGVSSIDGRKIGRLIVTSKEIAKGSNGTIVLEGNYEGRSVAVKRLVRTHHDVAVKEIQNLIASDQHPNIVRWYGVEYDQDFVYICLERCTCSLYDLISISTSKDQMTSNNQSYKLLSNLGISKERELELWKVNGYPSALLLKLMRDIVCGLAHLHELGIIHRDLKPQNVLVMKDRSISAKISDMGISKHLDGDMSSLTKHATGYGSSGWQAPEQLRHERQTRAVDLFSLGCVLFFCITGGKHPFGENLERDVNIVNARKDLFLIDHLPEATDLISRLLEHDPILRPKAIEVMNHPLFWDSETRLSFLRDVSDRVELEDRENASDLLEALESKGRIALGGKWDEKMENGFMNDIGRYRRYKYDSVRDLLRVIRNKLNHYRELSKEIREILGSVPEGFNSYFSARFPKLLIEVYHVVLSHCSEEEIFHKYFRNTRF